MKNSVDRVEAAPGEALERVGELIRTQDNRATQAPIFAVQQRKRIYGMDPDYTDDIAWIDSANDYDEADERTARRLEAIHRSTGKERDGWTRTGYRDEWEFVTACFTEAGCAEFIRINGHNLTDPRIYAYGSWRNAEWNAVRDHLAALPGTPAVRTPMEA